MAHRHLFVPCHLHFVIHAQGRHVKEFKGKWRVAQRAGVVIEMPEESVSCDLPTPNHNCTDTFRVDRNGRVQLICLLRSGGGV